MIQRIHASIVKLRAHSYFPGNARLLETCYKLMAVLKS
jgi:hypothetical protein